MLLVDNLLTVQSTTVARRKDDARILGVTKCLVSGERFRQNAPGDAKATMVIVVNLGHGGWVVKRMVLE